MLNNLFLKVSHFQPSTILSASHKNKYQYQQKTSRKYQPIISSKKRRSLKEVKQQTKQTDIKHSKLEQCQTKVEQKKVEINRYQVQGTEQAKQKIIKDKRSDKDNDYNQRDRSIKQLLFKQDKHTKWRKGRIFKTNGVQVNLTECQDLSTTKQKSLQLAKQILGANFTKTINNSLTIPNSTKSIPKTKDFIKSIKTAKVIPLYSSSRKNTRQVNNKIDQRDSESYSIKIQSMSHGDKALQYNNTLIKNKDVDGDGDMNENSRENQILKIAKLKTTLNKSKHPQSEQCRQEYEEPKHHTLCIGLADKIYIKKQKNKNKKIFSKSSDRSMFKSRANKQIPSRFMNENGKHYFIDFMNECDCEYPSSVSHSRIAIKKIEKHLVEPCKISSMLLSKRMPTTNPGTIYTANNFYNTRQKNIINRRTVNTREQVNNTLQPWDLQHQCQLQENQIIERLYY